MSFIRQEGSPALLRDPSWAWLPLRRRYQARSFPSVVVVVPRPKRAHVPGSVAVPNVQPDHLAVVLVERRDVHLAVTVVVAGSGRNDPAAVPTAGTPRSTRIGCADPARRAVPHAHIH